MYVWILMIFFFENSKIMKMPIHGPIFKKIQRITNWNGQVILPRPDCFVIDWVIQGRINIGHSFLENSLNPFPPMSAKWHL